MKRKSRPQRAAARRSTSRQVRRASELESPGTQSVVEQLQALEQARRDGPIELPGGQRIAVTNLHKVFWPKQKLTKGDLFRYYARVAPFILPAIADRPLVMKRFPNGVAAKPFYQHRAADVPPGVRVETVAVAETRAQLIGGDLLTLLYTTQLAAISQDPWFSRVQLPSSPTTPRSTSIRCRACRSAARSTSRAGSATSSSRSAQRRSRRPRAPTASTSTSRCRRARRTRPGCSSARSSRRSSPRSTRARRTIERTVAARGKRVYVDFLQNILGKTLATAYSARASDYAGVSTPLTWQEIDDGVDREAFTIQTVPARLKATGDLWAPLRKSKGVKLEAVSRYLERTSGRLKGDKR